MYLLYKIHNIISVSGLEELFNSHSVSQLKELSVKISSQ